MSRVLRAVLLLACCAAETWAQSSNATIRGSATDPTHAVIPGAIVTLTGVETGVQRKTTTNEAGLFTFPAVIPGPYKVTVEAPGMQTYEATLTLQLQVDAVVNATMKLGQTSTKVEVEAIAAMVQTESPTLGQSLERQRIEQLPVNGRGYQNLWLRCLVLRGRTRVSESAAASRLWHAGGFHDADVRRRGAERSVGRLGRGAHSRPGHDRRDAD